MVESVLAQIAIIWISHCCKHFSISLFNLFYHVLLFFFSLFEGLGVILVDSDIIHSHYLNILLASLNIEI